MDMNDALRMSLPDGRTTTVPAEQAREIAAALWDLGIAAGAATAATRILDGLGPPAVLRRTIAFNEREAAPLLRCVDGSITWTAPHRPTL